ncbi:hypothetical protein LC653_24720 [Nostoc sp. CHAB 5784]|uniref:hypothetical protein n=1 Tax=Nostoc mirabile TaxID=2907820 RepID=UPI001E5E093D|nr:hypothetical protein [Nostoc mirabile]MCC5667006.1 hypothetical protein [Nostoc mirabile CHAB5784]
MIIILFIGDFIFWKSLILRADFIVLLDKGQLKMQGVLEEMQVMSGEDLDFLTP